MQVRKMLKLIALCIVSTIAPSKIAFAQDNNSIVNKYGQATYTDPKMLARLLEAGEDPNKILNDDIFMYCLIRSRKGNLECLKVLLGSPKVKLNISQDNGCTFLKENCMFPEAMKIFLDFGALPYWTESHENQTQKVYLFPYLLITLPRYAGDSAMAAFEVALNHPVCAPQLTGKARDALLIQVENLQPDPPGWCGTGYNEYVKSFSTMKGRLLHKLSSN